jgi:hypothetical protein
MALTKRQIKKYIKEGGASCPYCGGDITANCAPDVDGGFAEQEMNCLHCDKGWFDYYTLTGIGEIEE